MQSKVSRERLRHGPDAVDGGQSSSGFAGWILLGFLGLVMFIGGGSRGDVTSLLILRPLAMIMLVYLIFTTPRGALLPYVAGLAGLLALVVLHVAHLIPLPPGLWTSLPGREPVLDALKAAGVSPGWHPLSLAPFKTWNGLFSLSVPFAVFLLAVRLRSRSANERIMLLLLAIAGLSALLGVMQAFAPYQANLYPFALTNRGTAVGLFANRNHNAAFLACIIPAAFYVYGSWQRSGRAKLKHTAGIVALVLLLLMAIVLSGSRAGLLVAALGLTSAPMFIENIGKTLRTHLVKLLIAALVFAIIAVIASFSVQTSTLNRTMDMQSDVELRLLIWPVIWREVWQVFPWGSGMGAFVETYKMIEPNELLRPQYVNRAHNDLLELLLDAGLPGLALMLGGVLAWIMAALRQFRRQWSDALSRLGLLVVAQLAIASFFDYPLRAPSVAALFAIAVVWAGNYRSADKFGDYGRKTQNELKIKRID